MSQARLVEPDLKFIEDLRAQGGDTLKKCFQCATCSVVCNLSPDDNPFPRKEMIWSQWGLKDRLVGDPDVWLCHQCNDCSKYCPRGAKPGDVLAVLRRQMIAALSFPSFLAKWVNDPKYLPVIFGIPIVIILIFTAAFGSFNPPRGPEGEIIYRFFFPQWPGIDVIFPLTALWAVICSAIGIRRYWTALTEAGPKVEKEYKQSPLEFVTLNVVPAIIEVLKHKNFKECDINKGRFLAHFNILWGFILLFITTACVATGVYLFHAETPYSILGNPIKWIGNIGAIILIVGSILAIRNRLALGEDAGNTTYFDWLFLIMVLVTGVSGFLTELLRLTNIGALAYPMYFIHLVCVLFLFAYHALFQVRPYAVSDDRYGVCENDRKAVETGDKLEESISNADTEVGRRLKRLGGGCKSPL